MNPNEIQHGGDHYKRAGNLQHWDSLMACGFGWEYYVGAATKYLTRVKDPINDPLKAGHFLDKLIWAVENGMVPERFQTTQQFRINVDAAGRRLDVPNYLESYFAANGMDPQSPAATAISILMQATHLDDLRTARETIRQMERPAKRAGTVGEAAAEHAQKVVDQTKAQDATAAYVDQDNKEGKEGHVALHKDGAGKLSTPGNIGPAAKTTGKRGGK